jgi:adenylate kinase
VNAVLLGAPGCGKGTQAERLTVRYKMVHASTGAIFREEIAKGSPLGQRVKQYVTSGGLVPDELTVEVISARLSQPDARAGFLLDGFPRTAAQAEALDTYLKSSDRRLDAVVYIKLSEEEVVKRLSNRRQCKTCGKIYNLVSHPPKRADACDADGGLLAQREDDKPETVRKRLALYNELTQPLIAFYQKAGSLRTVGGDGSVDDVTRRIEAELAPKGR